jgi:hypothetical protein
MICRVLSGTEYVSDEFRVYFKMIVDEAALEIHVTPIFHYKLRIKYGKYNIEILECDER